MGYKLGCDGFVLLHRIWIHNENKKKVSLFVMVETELENCGKFLLIDKKCNEEFVYSNLTKCTFSDKRWMFSTAYCTYSSGKKCFFT